jgi:hypothetical protein
MKNLLKIDELLLFGLDRGFGYDLRYPHAFNNTHLGTIGKAS